MASKHLLRRERGCCTWLVREWASFEGDCLLQRHSCSLFDGSYIIINVFIFIPQFLMEAQSCLHYLPLFHFILKNNPVKEVVDVTK